MDIYKEMYYRLFHKLADIVEEIQKIQLETEEMYMRQEEEEKAER